MLILAGAAYGQSGLGANTQAEFSVVSLSGYETLFQDSDGKQQTVYIGISKVGPHYPVPKNRQVELYTEEPNPVPGKPAIKVPQAKAVIPNGNGPFLIILNQNSSGDGLPYSSLVLDHSLEAHPSRTYLVYNFSKRRTAVKLGEEVNVFQSGESKIISYPDTRKAWLQVAVDRGDDSWLPLMSEPHIVTPHIIGDNTTRMTIFLVDYEPSERDPDPIGVSARMMLEKITTDQFGVQHIQ